MLLKAYYIYTNALLRSYFLVERVLEPKRGDYNISYSSLRNFQEMTFKHHIPEANAQFNPREKKGICAFCSSDTNSETFYKI